MKSIQDALYNWLTIKVVCDARPDDTAAVETKDLFENILTEDLGVTELDVTKDDTMYYVTYKVAGENKKNRFPVELIEILLNQINQDPKKYENYPVE